MTFKLLLPEVAEMMSLGELKTYLANQVKRGMLTVITGLPADPIYSEIAKMATVPSRWLFLEGALSTEKPFRLKDQPEESFPVDFIVGRSDDLAALAASRLEYRKGKSLPMNGLAMVVLASPKFREKLKDATRRVEILTKKLDAVASSYDLPFSTSFVDATSSVNEKDVKTEGGDNDK